VIINIICVGKTKKQWLQEGELEYTKKLAKYNHKVIWKIIDHETKGTTKNIVNTESQKLFNIIKDEQYILLDIEGNMYTSETFAILTNNHIQEGKITFVIGGSHGVNIDIISKAKHRLSLSSMTFVHEMVRVLLLEQVYRAEEINRGGEYHK
jgi:23S rRNA (pseudouridine1915-N3)-methyltransferase